MEINEVKQIEQETIGDFEEITSSIRQEDLGFALGAVSKNLYANNIGSFIRELVSNGVDANVGNENRTKEVSVEVRLYKEGDEWWFSVRDFGVGMTKQHFSEVYMNWFNSDKRGTNAKIGGWGLGSKTPLAYTDTYEVTTIANGIKYEYEITKTGTVPVASLILEKATSEESGTLVKFEVKASDLDKIDRELKNQLVYFNEVVVINEHGYYDNNFNILEADLFKYRPNNLTFGDDMHLVIGQVPYKIDFNLLGIQRVMMPIALKFEIGELPVTLSREDINYDIEGIDVQEIIRKRIEEVVQVITEKYNEFSNFDNLKDYLDFMTSTDKWLELAPGFRLLIDKDIIKTNAKILIDGTYYKFTKQATEKFIDVFKFYQISTTKLTDTYVSYLLTVLNSPSNYVLKLVDSNNWSNKYHVNKIAYTVKRYNRKQLIYFAESIKLDVTENSKFRGRYRVFKPGGLHTVISIIKFITSAVISKTSTYGFVPQAFIDADKRLQKEQTAARKGNITSYELNGTMITHNLDELLDKYENVFYIDRKESIEKLGYYNLLFDALPPYFHKKLILLQLNPTTIKAIKKYKTQVHKVEAVWTGKKLHNFFNRLPLLLKLGKLSQVSLEDLYNMSPYHTNVLKKAKNHYHLVHPETKYIRDLEKKETVVFENGDILPYFKRQLTAVKNNKSFIFEAEINEAYEMLPLIKLKKLIKENAYKGDQKELYRYVVSKSKLLKINRNLN